MAFTHSRITIRKVYTLRITNQMFHWRFSPFIEREWNPCISRILHSNHVRIRAAGWGIKQKKSEEKNVVQCIQVCVCVCLFECGSMGHIFDIYFTIKEITSRPKLLLVFDKLLLSSRSKLSRWFFLLSRSSWVVWNGSRCVTLTVKFEVQCVIMSNQNAIPVPVWIGG